jgi:4-hydroxy-2-oxoheptanedioate aldolase
VSAGGWRERRVRFGGFVSLPSLVVVEGFARAGYDFVILDMQHGTFGYEFVQNALQLLDVLGVESLLRLASDELALAARLLDFGATGIVLASVDDAATVAAAIRATRYQPEGTRSYGQQRKGLKAEPRDILTVRPSVFAMIETQAGLHDVNAIAAVPGLSGLVIGPSDLGLALGLGPAAGRADATWAQAIDTIQRAASSHGISACMVVGDGQGAAEWARVGFDRVVIGSDILHLFARMNGEIEQARALVRAAAQ